MMGSTGREDLQKYMDKLEPAINDALNVLAREKPQEAPLKVLAKLLDPEGYGGGMTRGSFRGSHRKRAEPVYAPSPELRALLGETGRERCVGLRAEEVILGLQRAGALVQVDVADGAGTQQASVLGRLDEGSDATLAVARSEPSKVSAAKLMWQKALRSALAHVKSHESGWAEYEIHKRPTELCKRWDYDARTNTWECSETLVKMEAEPFARGAMRECYRMKKMSQVNAHFFFHMNWEDCNNYVAKRYMKPGTTRDIYFDDIKMQMVSKRYARLYNSLQPPKGVDFLQAFVMEVERGGETLTFAVERAMEEEGAFVKYNNNSGYVDYGAGVGEDGEHRYTPHAFTRFTFDRSFGELMVVDIQGCDDVYTDPQIHTLVGDDYGDGNLGVGGMALFFSTSTYDSLCERLGLLKFALSPAEEARLQRHTAEQENTPGGRGQVPEALAAAAVAATADADAGNPSRLTATKTTIDNEEERSARLVKNIDLLKQAEAKLSARRNSVVGVASRLRVASALIRLSERASERVSERSADDEPSEKAADAASAQAAAAAAAGGDDGEIYEEFELPLKDLPLHFLGMDVAAARARREAGLPEAPPALTPPEAPSFDGDGDPVDAAPPPMRRGSSAVAAPTGSASAAALGAVHAKMCEYALVGRLPLQEGEADVASAGYHLICAAAAQDKRALLDLRSLCRGLPASEVLVGVKLRDADVAGLAPLLPDITHRLAAAGDISAMIEMASQAEMQQGDDGAGAGVDWLRAAAAKFDASTAEEQASLAQFGCARYQLFQKLAEALASAGQRAAAGEAYQEASEAAMEAGKMKVSMKLSALAEEMGGEEEEEEEEGN